MCAGRVPPRFRRRTGYRNAYAPPRRRGAYLPLKALLVCPRPSGYGARPCAAATAPPSARSRGSAFACKSRLDRSAPPRACCSRNTSTCAGRREREDRAKAPFWDRARRASSRTASHPPQPRNAARSDSWYSAARGPKSTSQWHSASGHPHRTGAHSNSKPARATIAKKSRVRAEVQANIACKLRCAG